MVDLERTSFFFVIASAWFLVVSASTSVTRVAVVGVTVAEPESDGAAIPALEVDELIAVFLTVFDSCTNRGCGALWAH